MFRNVSLTKIHSELLLALEVVGGEQKQGEVGVAGAGAPLPSLHVPLHAAAAPAPLRHAALLPAPPHPLIARVSAPLGLAAAAPWRGCGCSEAGGWWLTGTRAARSRTQFCDTRPGSSWHQAVPGHQPPRPAPHHSHGRQRPENAAVNHCGANTAIFMISPAEWSSWRSRICVIDTALRKIFSPDWKIFPTLLSSVCVRGPCVPQCWAAPPRPPLRHLTSHTFCFEQQQQTALSSCSPQQLEPVTVTRPLDTLDTLETLESMSDLLADSRLYR